jgi:hypothetical protein
MALFTIILDLAGGTYIAQVMARSAIQALQKWARRAPSLDIPAIGPKFPDYALKDLAFLDPTPITGLRNVWCTGIIIRGSYGLVNIISTDRHRTETGVSDLECLIAAGSKKTNKKQSV